MRADAGGGMARQGWRPAPVALSLVLLALTGCVEPEPLLPGPRFDPRALDEAAASVPQTAAEAAAGARAQAIPPQPPRRLPNPPYTVAGEGRPLSLPAARPNAEWTHRFGGPAHAVTHPALAANLTEVWSAPIGQGNSRRLRITADPVIAGGRIFTMDAVAGVQARAASGGGLIWARNLTPAEERAGEAAGGGLAASGGRLYVTTGYGRLHALDAASGAVLWTQELDAVPGAAPTVVDGIVYVTSRDARGWAVDAGNGRVLWQIGATETGSATLGGAAPAVSGRNVLFPFGSGELISALRQGGTELWTASIAGRRLGRAYAGITDVSADPVVVGGTVYVGNPQGRIVALDLASGTQRWTAPDGAASAVWEEGGALFYVSDQNELVRLDARTGTRIWAATLPLYLTDRVIRRQGIFAHYGPVLAGGRLVLASTDGILREVDPRSGALLRATRLPAAAARNPVVAGGTLYIVTANGQLHAFR